MKRFLKFTMLLCIVLASVSCRRAAEKARQKIRIEQVESSRMLGLSAAEVVIRVKNGSGYKLRLDEAELTLFYGGKKALAARLREPIGIDRRTTESLTTLWAVKIHDPLLLYAMMRRINAGEIDAVTLSYRIVGRGGPAKINISTEKIALSKFLDNFDLTINELKPYIPDL